MFSVTEEEDNSHATNILRCNRGIALLATAKVSNKGAQEIGGLFGLSEGPLNRLVSYKCLAGQSMKRTAGICLRPFRTEYHSSSGMLKFRQ